MYREFTAQGSHKWLSILPILIDNYSNSKHRTIGMTPFQAEENPALVILKQRTIANRKVKFHVGDKVRIRTQKGYFVKVFLPNCKCCRAFASSWPDNSHRTTVVSRNDNDINKN